MSRIAETNFSLYWMEGVYAYNETTKQICTKRLGGMPRCFAGYPVPDGWRLATGWYLDDEFDDYELIEDMPQEAS